MAASLAYSEHMTRSYTPVAHTERTETMTYPRAWMMVADCADGIPRTAMHDNWQKRPISREQFMMNALDTFLSMGITVDDFRISEIN